MDGILSDGRKGKLWLCSKDSHHALGLVLRVEVSGRFLDRLLLFRKAAVVSDTVAVVIDASVLGEIEGTMHDIECDLCNAKRTWWMGEAALDRFIARRQERA